MMGYFSNGSEGMDYQRRYCDRCEHDHPEFGCPIWHAHLEWNYEECNNDDSILHKMIPRTDGGNGECTFMVGKNGGSKPWTCVLCGKQTIQDRRESHMMGHHTKVSQTPLDTRAEQEGA